MNRRLFLLIATLASAGGVLLRGQPPPPPQQPPAATFRSSVEAVQLSVIVTDADGNPVAGLTQDDFEIVENGLRQPITTFSAINIPIERREKEIAERDVVGNDGPPGRLYVIALDEMSPSSALRARDFLRKFIENYFGPNDTAAVVLTTSGPGDSGQEFTNNPRLLLRAIDRFGGGGTDAEPFVRERNFLGDFKNLMAFMSTLRGTRKAMIFVSESVPVDAYTAVSTKPARFAMFSEIEPELIDALSFATRNNIVIYPIDPRGLSPQFTNAESDDPLVQERQARGISTAAYNPLEDRLALGGLATVTGGFSLSGSNNYDAAFERLVIENSVYYDLGFNSAVSRRDGGYVRVEVRVKRPGLQVRTVEGYVAPRGRPQELRRPKTVMANVWDAVASAITTSGLPMRVNAAAFKHGEKNKEATVAITVEFSPSKLNLVEENGAFRGTFEILFAVTDSKNKKRWPIYRTRALMALKPETYERVTNGAMRVVSQLPLPEGRYQLRASAGSESVAGGVVYDFEVPDFRDDFSLSGMTLTSVQTRETFTFSSHKQIDVTLPGPPTTVREFSRDDVLTLFAEGYENRRKPHEITLTLQLRDESGRVIGTHEMDRKSVDKPKGPSVYKFAPNLSLDEIPPGRYALRVDARSSLDRNKNVVREIPFTVR